MTSSFHRQLVSPLWFLQIHQVVALTPLTGHSICKLQAPLLHHRRFIMHPCDICQQIDFYSARGLAIHMSRIHHNWSFLSMHPTLMHDVLSDDEDRMHTEDEPNRETPIPSTESIPDSAPMGHDLSTIDFENSSAILTHVCRTVQYPRCCGTTTQDPKWRHPWECADWQPLKPFRISEDYDLAYAY